MNELLDWFCDELHIGKNYKLKNKKILELNHRLGLRKFVEWYKKFYK